MVWGVFSWLCLVSLVCVPTSSNEIQYLDFPGGLPPSIYSVLLSAWQWSFPARQQYLSQVPVGYWLLRLKSYRAFLECFGTRSARPSCDTNDHTELWTVLANIWQVVPVERLQKIFKSMPFRVVNT
ncbi:UNVERIFIED_CONTAM: hypothetical protein NCL1_10949 [Trichonephila clavipes]